MVKNYKCLNKYEVKEWKWTLKKETKLRLKLNLASKITNFINKFIYLSYLL